MAGTTTTVPSAAASSSVRVLDGLVAGTTASLADNPEAENSRNQEEDGGQEGESHVGLVLSALVASSDVAPSPDAAARVVTVEVSQEGKGDDPEDEEDQVDWPFCERGKEWEEEEEGKEDGDCGNDNGVNVSLVC